MVSKSVWWGRSGDHKCLPVVSLKKSPVHTVSLPVWSYRMVSSTYQTLRHHTHMNITHATCCATQSLSHKAALPEIQASWNPTTPASSFMSYPRLYNRVRPAQTIYPESLSSKQANSATQSQPQKKTIAVSVYTRLLHNQRTCFRPTTVCLKKFIPTMMHKHGRTHTQGHKQTHMDTHTHTRTHTHAPPSMHATQPGLPTTNTE